MTAPAPALFVQPTARQLEVAQAIADGLTDQGIADRLDIGLHTVHTHVEQLRDRLGARNRAHVVALCFQHGLLPTTR